MIYQLLFLDEPESKTQGSAVMGDGDGAEGWGAWSAGPFAFGARSVCEQPGPVLASRAGQGGAEPTRRAARGQSEAHGLVTS